MHKVLSIRSTKHSSERSTRFDTTVVSMTFYLVVFNENSTTFWSVSYGYTHRGHLQYLSKKNNSQILSLVEYLQGIFTANFSPPYSGLSVKRPCPECSNFDTKCDGMSYIYKCPAPTVLYNSWELRHHNWIIDIHTFTTWHVQFCISNNAPRVWGDHTGNIYLFHLT